MSRSVTLPRETSRLIDRNCRYCEIAEHELSILKSDYGVVVPSVGALVEGWVLVFPANHVLSLAELDNDGWSAFSELLSTARCLVEQVYGSTIMFEHGSAGVGRTAACGVDHAHMHIVPIDLDIRAAVAECAEAVGSFVWTQSSNRVSHEPGTDYIYASDRTGSWVTRSAELPSQVVRRAIAKAIGVDDWDWKVDSRSSNVDKTRSRLLAI